MRALATWVARLYTDTDRTHYCVEDSRLLGRLSFAEQSGGFSSISQPSSLTLRKRWTCLSKDTAQHPGCTALITSNLATVYKTCNAVTSWHLSSWIMMETVPHITAWAGRKKYQADGFLFDGVYLMNIHSLHLSSWIMMATVPHITAWAGRTKYQGVGFLFDGVYLMNKYSLPLTTSARTISNISQNLS